MNGSRILVGSGLGTLVVWGVATVDPYLALGAGAVGAGAAVGVQRAIAAPIATDGDRADGRDADHGRGNRETATDGSGDATDDDGGDAAEIDDGGNAADGAATEPRPFDFEGAVAAVGTLLVVLGGSLLSGTVAGQTGSAIVDALVVLGVFGYSLFGLLVPGFSLAGLGGAAVSRRLARRVDG